MQVNYLAVFVGGIISFLLGGIWYSKLFGKLWMSEIGKSEDELKKISRPINYFFSFILGLMTSYILAHIIIFLGINSVLEGIEVAILCWIGFTGATSYSQNMFEGRTQKLWMINSGYYLVAYILNGILFTVWK